MSAGARCLCRRRFSVSSSNAVHGRSVALYLDICNGEFNE
jgi:hypothetical protein